MFVGEITNPPAQTPFSNQPRFIPSQNARIDCRRSAGGIVHSLAKFWLYFVGLSLLFMMQTASIHLSAANAARLFFQTEGMLTCRRSDTAVRSTQGLAYFLRSTKKQLTSWLFNVYGLCCCAFNRRAAGWSRPQPVLSTTKLSASACLNHTQTGMRTLSLVGRYAMLLKVIGIHAAFKSSRPVQQCEGAELVGVGVGG